MTPTSFHRATHLARVPILLAGIALLLADDAVAQRPHHDPYFIPIGAKTTEHMPRVIVRTMQQDRAGDLWFATFGGPIRYDGKVFTNFGDEVRLAKTRIFSLLEARSGDLWFGSITGGVSRYDGESAVKFTKEPPVGPVAATAENDVHGLASDDVHWIFEDRDGGIWWGPTGGVSRYDGESLTNFTTEDGLLHNAVYSIAQDPTGRLWFGTQTGVCSYDGESFTDLADAVGRSFVNVRAVAVDASGDLWFGGEQGGFRYDGEQLTTFTTEDGLLDTFVGSLAITRTGDVWFGHPGRFPDFKGGGATRYDGESFEQIDREDGLTLDTVYCMLEDEDGNMWFGSSHDGVCRYDGKTFVNLSAPTTRDG